MTSAGQAKGRMEVWFDPALGVVFRIVLMDGDRELSHLDIPIRPREAVEIAEAIVTTAALATRKAERV